uniref:Ricin B lectin domain-containing protein n=1 Tax=uncultured prokaryote TaxID=198431 RepID=A0A0H5Q4U0_9ZZZZ|nr:hypothetical protein [uncultured prokaryote]
MTRAQEWADLLALEPPAQLADTVDRALARRAKERQKKDRRKALLARWNRRLVSLALSLVLTAALVPAQAAKTYDKISNGTYIVSSKASESMKLDMLGTYTGKATNAQVYKYTPANLTQQFQFTYNKDKSWYGIYPMSNTKMALNAYSNKPVANTNVNVWPKDSKNSTQNWVLERVEGNYYIIRLAYNKNLVLTATGTKNMSNVKLTKYTGSSKQIWKLTPLKTPGSSATVISEATAKKFDQMDEANKKLCQLAKKESIDALGKILHQASLAMKCNYNRADN